MRQGETGELGEGATRYSRKNDLRSRSSVKKYGVENLSRGRGWRRGDWTRISTNGSGYVAARGRTRVLPKKITLIGVEAIGPKQKGSTRRGTGPAEG